MDIDEQDQSQNDFEETFTENSVDPDSSDSTDTFGEQVLFPRVGDEYQAAIPEMLTPAELLKYLGIPYDSQSMFDVSHNLLIGLPVLITWVNKEVRAIKDEAIEVRDEVDSSRMDHKKELNVNEFIAAPGLPTDDWSEFDVDSFLVGLYIFGKNLLQVKRFMESKEMGQILSFYYGRFFRTDKHRRWADCRKTKGRKCIIGQRLLIGSRQQELFSRLLPRLSEESKTSSLEAYRAFSDGRTSVEEYIWILKDIVGIHALVEAVAIGKVNKDLTVMAMEPSRFPSRPEMAPGKACSDLTYEEILKYLSGDIRLSKARSGDLFWEAIWPRLLAKGWHSEKPKDEAYRSSRNCLVFIVPGIKKFRRKLLKGGHYFDSASDVLKKVASEPELLLLETEGNGNAGSNHDHNRYLKPRISSEAPNHMKFTVVDTSLLHEDQPSNVRELRSLPAKAKNSSADPEKATDLSDKLRDYIVYNHSKGQPRGGGKKRTAHNGFYLPLKPVKNHSECVDPVVKRRKLPDCSMSETKPTVGGSKGQPKGDGKKRTAHNFFYLPLKPVKNHSECVDLVVKRRELPACSISEIKPIVGGSPKPLIVSQNNLVLKLPAPSKKPLVADDQGEMGNKGDPNQGCCSSSTSNESYERSHPLIDLNKPQAPAETEVSELAIEAKVEEGNDSSQNSSNDGFCYDELANGNSRRHGTRIRPMSTKALEALESSFFNSKAAKKRLSGDSEEEKPRKSQRPRKKRFTPENCTEAMRPNGIHNAANDVISETAETLS